MTAVPVAEVAAETPAPASSPAPGGAETIVSPADGAIKPVTEVPDETFAAKILGDGFAVIPTTGRILAPVSGTVTTVADAKHAVGITTAGGVEVLVHIGVDTVEMGGAPFTVHVAAGQQVSAGEPVADVDLAAVAAAGKPTDVIVVFTNPAAIQSLDVTATGGVAAGLPVGTFTVR